MKSYVRIRGIRAYGAPVYIHIAAIAIALVLFVVGIGKPVLGAITLLSYFGVIFLHEMGHAFTANRYGCKVFAIYIGFFHGRCEAAPPSERQQQILFYWGGVIAQLLIAVPLIVLAQTVSLNEVWGFGPIVVFLGYISALIAVVNLAPFPGLDGGEAWKIVPLWLKDRKSSKVKKNRKGFKVV